MPINKEQRIWDRSEMDWQESSDDDRNWRGVGEYDAYVAPKFLLPFFAAIFALGAGGLAVIFFGAGLIGLGVIFSIVVPVALYVLWNNIQKWRAYQRRRALQKRH